MLDSYVFVLIVWDIVVLQLLRLKAEVLCVFASDNTVTLSQYTHVKSVKVWMKYTWECDVD